MVTDEIELEAEPVLLGADRGGRETASSEHTFTFNRQGVRSLFRPRALILDADSGGLDKIEVLNIMVGCSQQLVNSNPVSAPLFAEGSDIEVTYETAAPEIDLSVRVRNRDKRSGVRVRAKWVGYEVKPDVYDCGPIQG